MNQPDVVWRGGELSRLGQNELLDGKIQRTSSYIYDIDEAETDVDTTERNAFFGRQATDLPYEVSRRVVTMTPGFTTNQGTALHFSNTSPSDVGLVLGFDPRALPDLTPVEYDAGFMHNHEGVLARVETLADGEVRHNGRLVGLTNDGEIRAWGDETINNRASAVTYEKEAELFTYEDAVDAGDAVHTVLCVVNAQGGTTDHVNNRLGEMPGYTPYFGEGEVVEFMDEEEKVEALHEQITARMGRWEGRLVVLLMEYRHIPKDGQLDRDEFVMGYSRGGVFYDPDDPILRYPGGRVL